MQTSQRRSWKLATQLRLLMPTYEYSCEKCGQTFEAFQSMRDEPSANSEGALQVAKVGDTGK